MLVFKKRHQILNNLDEYWFLLLQDIDPRVLAELKCVNETCVLYISHPIICLNLKRGCNSSAHSFFFDMVLHHRLVDSSSSGSLSQLHIGHHQMFFVRISQHVFQILLQLEPEQETSSNLLNFNNLLSSFVEVDLDIIPGSVTSIQTLYENTRTVSLEDSPEPVYIYFQIEQMLFSRFFFGVVGNVEFHELVETSKSIAKRCIFNSFFVGYNKIIKGEQSGNTIDQEMSVTWDATYWVRK